MLRGVRRMRNLDQALTDEQLRIIGVEFNVTRPDGQGAELAMFVPNGTGLVIPRSASLGGYLAYRPTITFHSTIGDYTIGNQDYACPW